MAMPKENPLTKKFVPKGHQINKSFTIQTSRACMQWMMIYVQTSRLSMLRPRVFVVQKHILLLLVALSRYEPARSGATTSSKISTYAPVDATRAPENAFALYALTRVKKTKAP